MTLHVIKGQSTKQQRLTSEGEGMTSSTSGQKVIVITGASSGIGKATAKQLVDEGFKVALMD